MTVTFVQIIDNMWYNRHGDNNSITKQHYYKAGLVGKEKLWRCGVGKNQIRNIGIDIIGTMPWGTHFCQFYDTKQDLFDILVPYFKAGLENNEFCIWVTSEPLNEKEAKQAMEKAVPNFAQYLEGRQMEIVPHTALYLKDGVFNGQRILNAWIDKLNQALAKCYDGMRVTGNVSWFEEEDWASFIGYEEEINGIISNKPILAICTYPLAKCSACKLIDVMHNHQNTIIGQSVVVLEQKIIKQPVFKSSQGIFDYLYHSMRDLKKELFKVLYLNSQNQIMDTEDLFKGTLDGIHIYPREIEAGAIKHNATGLIFAHNHPSGDCTPSRNDKNITRDLVFIGKVLQIKVLDHIIIGADRYLSFADEGLIEKYEDDFLNLRLRTRLMRNDNQTEIVLHLSP